MARTLRADTAIPDSVGCSLTDCPPTTYESIPAHCAKAGPGSQHPQLCDDGCFQHCLDLTVELVTTAHRKARGSTVSLSYGSLLGFPLYAVAGFPGSSVKLAIAPTSADVRAFILQNLRALQRPDRGVGSWVDPEFGTHALDVVVCVARRDYALRLGERLGERYIYDLHEGVNLSVVSGLSALKIAPSLFASSRWRSGLR